MSGQYTLLRAVDSPLRASYTRSDLINFYAKQIDAVRYLEIGVQTGRTFEAVDLPIKVGVDPDPASKATIYCGSDQYFELIDENKKFDIIYVDGLHEAHQAYRDIENAVKHLSENGIIIVDDIAPKRHAHQTPRPTALHWTGDVWRSWFKAIHTFGDRFDMFTVDIAFGQGVMIPKSNTKITAPIINRSVPALKDLNWDYYVSHHQAYHSMMLFEDIGMSV